MLSTPADFPFFSDCTATSSSLQRMGWSSFVSFWGQISTDGSPLAVWLYSSVHLSSAHLFSISRSSVRHFPELSWTVVAFPCFTVVKFFRSWYALLFFLRFSSISLYAFESWTLTAELQRRIQAMEMGCYHKILHISHKDHVTNKEVHAKIQQAIWPHEDLLTIVKRCKLQWYGHVSFSSGLAKTILQGTVKGGRRQGR